MRDRPTLGLVGCGDWGRHILRDLRSLGCEVHVVARSDASRARAEDYGASAIVGELADLPPVDGVVVATPTSTHAAVLEDVIALGAPVFVEKPMTADAETARSLAARAPDRLFVMDKWRYHPGVEALAGIARSGELGAVVGVVTTRIGWGNPHRDVDVIWILAPHDLSIALEVIGRLPDPVSAVAERADGCFWSLAGVLGSRPYLRLEISGASAERRREVRLVCEAGVAWLPGGYSEAIGVARWEGVGSEPERRPISTELPLLRELRCFVEHLEGGPPPRSSADEGALVVERVEQLRALATSRA
jgi:predicted dehydrogenase